MAITYEWDERGVRALIASHQQQKRELESLRRAVNGLQQGRYSLNSNSLYILGKVTTEVTAMSGSTAGTGQVTFCYRNRDDSVITEGNITGVTVYNAAGSVAVDKIVGLLPDRHGDLWVIVEDCQ